MIIRTDNLVKTYGERNVVNGVSIEVEQGTIVGLLGPNGAGKTTTFYMIVGIEKPDAGVVTLDGQDISALAITGSCATVVFSAAGTYTLASVGFSAVLSLGTSIFSL